eukprot:15342969-Alexandrium_andersonii.AAC.1
MLSSAVVVCNRSNSRANKQANSNKGSSAMLIRAAVASVVIVLAIAVMGCVADTVGIAILVSRL